MISQWARSPLKNTEYEVAQLQSFSKGFGTISQDPTVRKSAKNQTIEQGMALKNEYGVIQKVKRFIYKITLKNINQLQYVPIYDPTFECSGNTNEKMVNNKTKNCFSAQVVYINIRFHYKVEFKILILFTLSFKELVENKSKQEIFLK